MNISSPSIVDIFNAVAALLSLALSIYAVIRVEMSARPKLQVKAMWGTSRVSSIDETVPASPVSDALFYSIHNIGEKPIYIYAARIVSDYQTLGILLSKDIASGMSNPPYKLEAGEMMKGVFAFPFFPEGQASEDYPITGSVVIEATKNKAKLIIEDGAGNIYRCKVKGALTLREVKKYGPFPWSVKG
jgi:hypothetical protein